MKLRDYAKTINLSVGCQSAFCVWGRPTLSELEDDCNCSSVVDDLLKVAKAALAEIERHRIHAALPVTVDYTNPMDMRRAAAMYTHDLALLVSTTGEVVLGLSVKALVDMLEKTQLDR